MTLIVYVGQRTATHSWCDSICTKSRTNDDDKKDEMKKSIEAYHVNVKRWHDDADKNNKITNM